jgi:signal transduction histidine kinase
LSNPQDQYEVFRQHPHNRILSWIGVPLIVGDNVIGLITLDQLEPDCYTDQHARLALAFASQAAIAIENARAYEELERTKGLIGAWTAVAWMGMASSTWRHAVQGWAITIRDQIGLLRHDLRGMRVSSRTADRLSRVERLAARIIKAPITPPLAEEEGVTSFSINGLLQERMEQLQQREPYKSVSCKFCFELDNKATVRASPSWLQIAIGLVVENAVKAMAPPNRRQLTVTTRPVGGGVEISFADTGMGIPDDILPSLFREQIKVSEGMGMGLLKAMAIVQVYGGRIYVGASNPNGTTMIIWLPLADQNKRQIDV